MSLRILVTCLLSSLTERSRRDNLQQCRRSGDRHLTIAVAECMLSVIGLLSCAPARPERFRVVVPENSRAVVVPFKLAGGWIVVQSVRNRDTASLILDTGADWTGLDRSWATTNGARIWPASDSAGAKGRAWALLDTMRLDGGLRILQKWIVLEPQSVNSLSEANGRLVRGYIGHDVLQHFTVEIDYAARLLRLYDPDYYSYAGSGVSIPFVGDSSEPIVQSILVTRRGDSIKARLRLDTGDGRACVILNWPFVQQHNVSEIVTPTVEGSPLISLDGPLRVLLGGALSLRFGDVTVDSPTVVLGAERQGFLADSTEDGTIGNRVFHNSRLIVDYAHRRAILEPGASLGRRDCAYDLSGLTFTAFAPTFRIFRVRYVLPHSAGAEAGIQPGDELVSMDGRSAGELDLEDLRQALRMDGAVRHLRLVRGPDTTLVSLMLRRLF
jgi:hypothetical protein